MDFKSVLEFLLKGWGEKLEILIFPLKVLKNILHGFRVYAKNENYSSNFFNFLQKIHRHIKLAKKWVTFEQLPVTYRQKYQFL